MSKKTTTNRSINSKKYHKVSVIAYLIIILTTSLLLLIEPNGLDVRMIILPLLGLLLLSSLGIGHMIAGKSESRVVKYAGIIALAILFTFVGFFIVSAVAWFIGVNNSL